MRPPPRLPCLRAITDPSTSGGSGDGPAAQAGELLLGEADVLGRLHDPDLVILALRLNGDRVVAAELVDADVAFGAAGSLSVGRRRVR